MPQPHFPTDMATTKGYWKESADGWVPTMACKAPRGHIYTDGGCIRASLHGFTIAGYACSWQEDDGYVGVAGL
eukprot:431160-Prorocentrum_lima.AAC.1